jgi:hypothetical protein
VGRTVPGATVAAYRPGLAETRAGAASASRGRTGMGRQSRKPRESVCGMLVLALALWPAAAAGQATKSSPAPNLVEWFSDVPMQEVAPLRERSFGTEDEAVAVIPAARFKPLSSFDSWDILILTHPSDGFVARSGSGTVTWLGAVRLPSGAEVTRLEVSACDGSDIDEVQFALLETSSPVGNFAGTGNRFVTAVGTTGLASTPECGVFSVPVSAPLTVDNADRYYAVYLRTIDAGFPGVVFDVARVFYRLRVSPAPAVATFADVPTGHGFFPFVEALVAAGITAGCAPDLYCVNDPITRGEMAVFLSKALGLHFAP